MKKRIRLLFLSILLCMLLSAMGNVYAVETDMAYTLTEMRMRDCDTEEVYTYIPQKRLFAEVTLTNTGVASMDRLLFVSYSPEGQMLDMKALDFQIDPEETAAFGVPVDNTDGRIGSICVFVVPSNGFMQPLANSLGMDGKELDTDEEDRFAGKTLDDFTVDDYFTMDTADQEAFLEHFFGSDDQAFFDWLDSQIEDPVIEELPWENGGKTPDQYTLDAYLDLSEDLQHAFQEWFGSDEAFYAWLDSQIGDPDIDEDPFAGKTLDNFTFEDYFEMDSIAQAAFCEQFFGGDDAALFDWLDSQIEEPDLDE